MIELEINGVKKEVAEGQPFSEILKEFGFESLDGVAVAANGKIVPKSNFASFNLENGMKIEVFSLVAGG